MQVRLCPCMIAGDNPPGGKERQREDVQPYDYTAAADRRTRGALYLYTHFPAIHLLCSQSVSVFLSLCLPFLPPPLSLSLSLSISLSLSLSLSHSIAFPFSLRVTVMYVYVYENFCNPVCIYVCLVLVLECVCVCVYVPVRVPVPECVRTHPRKYIHCA